MNEHIPNVNYRLDELEKSIQEMGLELTTEQVQKLAQYLEILFKWNKTFNLTAIDDFSVAWKIHILDALSLVPIIKEKQSLLDVGSGAGIPGIPVAIALPHLQVTLLDGNNKKSTFQQHAVINLGLKNVIVKNSRVESFQDNQYDVVTARAFGELADFVRLTKHLLKEDGILVGMKGVYPYEELSHLDKMKIQVVDVVKANIPQLQQERHIVILKL